MWNSPCGPVYRIRIRHSRVQSCIREILGPSKSVMRWCQHGLSVKLHHDVIKCVVCAVSPLD